jgi:hypothetical protein
MSPNSELPVPNLFLASLPQDDFEALRPHFERVRLSLGQILHKMGSPIEHCHFTDGGMIPHPPDEAVILSALRTVFA